MRALPLLPLLLPLAGCLVLSDGCPDDAATSRQFPDVGTPGIDAERGWHGLVLLPEGPGGDWSLESEATAGWTSETAPLGPGPGPTLHAWRLGAGAGPAEATLRTTHERGDCQEVRRSTTDVRAEAAGEVAVAGQGVHVLTAGFWPNGTLFYTNIEALHASDWPRAGWYAWEGGDPLPVYVYDEEPSERPPWWGDPQAGTPAAGTVPGLGYFVTIPGFNAALQQASTRMGYVAHLAPEEGYTRPGAEEHPLYGDELVFFVQVVDVVDAPCPAGVEPLLCAVPTAQAL